MEPFDMTPEENYVYGYITRNTDLKDVVVNSCWMEHPCSLLGNEKTVQARPSPNYDLEKLIEELENIKEQNQKELKGVCLGPGNHKK